VEVLNVDAFGRDQMATALLVFTPEETANRLKVSLS
jgi:hypothetical protein